MARCIMERLMRTYGWRGVTRRKKVRTTIADPAATRVADLVKRQFLLPAPNSCSSPTSPYVRLASGVCVRAAFAVDAYAGRIVGWTCSSAKSDAFVRRAIRHARNSASVKIHRSYAKQFIMANPGSRYRSVRRGETLSLSGLVLSIGSVGDAFADGPA